MHYCFWHSGGVTERDRMQFLKRGSPSGWLEATTVQLHRMKFNAHRDLGLDTLSENGLEIYKALVIKHEGLKCFNQSLEDSNTSHLFAG